MARSVTRDQHSLRRNLKLNDNYISNDGGDEGITVDNDGIVTASSQIDIGNMSLTTSELDVSSGNLTLDVAGVLYLDGNTGITLLSPHSHNESDKHVIIDHDNTYAGSVTSVGLEIDYDDVSATGLTDTLTSVALDINLNSSGVKTGTSKNYGIDIDMSAGTNGTQTNYGIDISCTGADSNYGIIVLSSHRQLYLDYDGTGNNCAFTVADGTVTIATGAIGAKDLILNVSGNIELNADGGTIDFKDASVNLATITAGSLAFDNAANATLVIDATAAGTAGRDLTIEASTAATAASNDTDGGDLILKAGGGDGTGTSAMTFFTKVSGTDATAERMRIHTDGNVGIGNPVPGALLEISKVSGAATLELSSWSATATEAHAGKLKFQKSGTATVNTFTAGDHTTAGEILGRIEAWGVDDADGETLSSYIEFANDAVSDADSSPGKIVFATSDATDAGNPSAALTIDDGQNLIMKAGSALFLDGGGDTYIYEHAADHVRFFVGGDTLMNFTEAGTDGNTVLFIGSCAGFTQYEPTYSATDTYVYFQRNGNKAHLTFTSASETITDVHLYFPNVSCNCLLLIKQHASGGGAVTNWKTWDAAGGNESTVVWAGGSAPTLTTGGSKIDILSFYWDDDNHKAYGVASLNF